MDMYDMLLAAQLISEERVGKVYRQHAREVAAGENQAKAHLLREVTA